MDFSLFDLGAIRIKFLSYLFWVNNIDYIIENIIFYSFFYVSNHYSNRHFIFLDFHLLEFCQL